MVIRRCAWHRQYVGHRGGYRLESWRGGFGLSYTDGICNRCAGRVRAERTVKIRVVRSPWTAYFYPARSALIGATLAIVSALTLPSTFLDETLWRPNAIIVVIPPRAPETAVVPAAREARRVQTRRLSAARSRPSRVVASRPRPAVRVVLVAPEATRHVSAAATPAGRLESPPKAPAAKALDDSTDAAPRAPAPPRKPALVAWMDPRPAEPRIEAP